MHSYPLPTGLWSTYVEVVGTGYYQATINRLARRLGFKDRLETYHEAALILEPDNPYGERGHAIAVHIGGHIIGHLSQEAAHTYWQLGRIAASGYTPTSRVRVWGFWEDSNFRAWIRISLPAPDYLYPLNDPPVSDWCLLPRSSAVQVTKEEDHLDVLSDYVPISGTGLLLTTLHIIEGGVRKTWPLIEVRLDGERVGELTRKMSENYVPTVRHFDDLGVATAALTVIRGSSISVQLSLYAARAFEMDESVLERPEGTMVPRLVPFEPDPDDYHVPNGYVPDPTPRAPKTTSRVIDPFTDSPTEEPAPSFDIFDEGTPVPAPLAGDPPRTEAPQSDLHGTAPDYGGAQSTRFAGATAPSAAGTLQLTWKSIVAAAGVTFGAVILLVSLIGTHVAGFYLGLTIFTPFFNLLRCEMADISARERAKGTGLPPKRTERHWAAVWVLTALFIYVLLFS